MNGGACDIVRFGRSRRQHGVCGVSEMLVLIRIVNIFNDVFRIEQDHNVMSQKTDGV